MRELRLVLGVILGILVSMGASGQAAPLLPIGDRGGNEDPAYELLMDSSAVNDFSDDAGNSAGHYLSKIPASAIVTRFSCESTGGHWENTPASALQVGDKLMVVVKDMNVSNNYSMMTFGAVGYNNSTGAILWATVADIQTGTLPEGGTYWKLCSQALTGDGPYCNSLVEGTFAVYQPFYSTCDPYNPMLGLKNKFKFVGPANISSQHGIWWMVDQTSCGHYCCSIGQLCDCSGIAFGCPDALVSSSAMVAGAAMPWVSLQIALPIDGQGWKNYIKNHIGAGTWKIKVALPIQGDSWTDRTNILIDKVGHLVGMDKYSLVVP